MGPLQATPSVGQLKKGINAVYTSRNGKHIELHRADNRVLIMKNKKLQDITEDEATLYDRQIRLWGLDSQKRCENVPGLRNLLRAAKILVIGLKGLGAEVCKNIVLAGVKSVVMMDHENVKQEDFAYQFFVSRENLDKNIAESSLERARQLNPMVEVSADSENVSDKSDSFFTAFDVICATQCTFTQIVRLNQICRLNGIKFFAGDIFGFFGYMFADLQIHEYSVEVNLPQTGKVSRDAPKKTINQKKTATFVPFQDLLDIDWKSDEQTKVLKKVGNGYFIMQVLQTFRAIEGHSPTRYDFAKLKAIRDTVLSNIGVDVDRVSDHILEQTFSQAGPVCAVVGGVLAQEIIKAVSQRDPPHNNCFFFDPDTCSGKVECIGSS